MHRRSAGKANWSGRICGIVAIYAPGSRIDERALRAAAQRLHHRGPDARGCWVAADGSVGLGHTRLSIIDLHTGDQPIANEDGQRRIVVNGEFYDFDRIRTELEHRGHVFRTRSDSEIALHLYEEHGLAFLEHLRGEFAFVLWDGVQKRLVVGRDRFGIKPCFFTEVGGALFIASEVKALFECSIQRAWDGESLFQQLFIGTEQDRSLFKGIRQIPPGHLLLADAEGVRIDSYWDFDYRPEEDLDHVNGTACAEQLRDALVEATCLRLRSDVPVGCYLSGGIDSSSLLAIAAEHGEAPPHAFSIQFDLPAYDESEFARQSAESVGAPFSALKVGRADLATHFEKAVVDFEMLFENAHYVARERLSHATHEAGMKVVLCGEGSDEIFAGYATCVSDMAAIHGRSTRSDPLHSPVGNDRPNDEHLQVITRWTRELEDSLGFLPSFLRGLVPVRAMLLRCLDRDWLSDIGIRNPYLRFVEQFDMDGQLAGRHPVRQSLYLWSKSIFANYILAADRVDMAHSVEVRLPFLDHHLVELARDIPVGLLVDERRGKLLLRQAMRPYVTRSTLDRVKKLFMAPPITVYDDATTMSMIQDRLRSTALDRVPLFNRAAVTRMLDGLAGMSAFERLCLEPVLLNALSATILAEKYRL